MGMLRFSKVGGGGGGEQRSPFGYKTFLRMLFSNSNL